MDTTQDATQGASQPQGPFCQSCAMPMQRSEDFGTNADGGKNDDYCVHCYQNGAFTDLNATMEQMIEKSAGIMKQMQLPEAAIEQVKQFIPTLKRWRKE